MAATLRQETPVIGNAAQWPESEVTGEMVRSAAVGGDANNNQHRFPVGLSGGTIMWPHLAAPEDQGILWQIDNSTGAILRLTDFKLSQCQLQASVVIPVACQLFPAVVLLDTSSDQQVTLVTLTADRSIMLVAMSPNTGSGTSIRSQQRQPCQYTVHIISIASQLMTHGSPSSLGATPDHLCIGCSTGVVVCIPIAVLLSAVNNNSQFLHPSSPVFELRSSNWSSSITGLIASVWQGNGATSTAALACMPVTSTQSTSPSLGARHPSSPKAPGADLLIVAYDDCSVSCWSVTKRQQVFVDTLLLPAAETISAGSAVSTYCPSHVSASSPAHDVLVVVAQLNALDSAARMVTCITYTMASSGRLQSSSSSPWRVALDVDPRASVLGSAAGKNGEAWLLLGSAGLSGVVGYSRSTGQLCCSVQLHQPGGMSGGAGNTFEEPDMMTQEMWLDVLSCSGSSEEDSAAQHVLPLILAPGCGNRVALRNTLASYGEPLTVEEAAGTNDQVTARICTAVTGMQRRNPGSSMAQCWIRFRMQFQETWSRAHPVLGLVAPRTLGSTSSSVYLARGGGMLSVLRPVTAVESFASRGQSLALAGLLEPMQVVHSCVQIVSNALGLWALESALQLAIAGVDLKGKLLPQLSKLLVSGPKGPSSSAAGGSSRTGLGLSTGLAGTGASGPAVNSGSSSRVAWAVSDQGRQAQMTWRRCRQQLLLTLGQQLGGMAEPLTHIRDYCQLITSSDSGCAGFGQGAPVISPLLAVNMFAHTASQISAARCSSTLNILVMLALVHDLQGVGAAPLPQSALAEIEQALIPALVEHLRRAAVALWLATTTSSQGSQLDPDELAVQALSHMRLGGVRQAGTSAASLPQQQRPGSLSLAAVLLPEFLKGHRAIHGGDPSASFQDRVLHLGFHLFSRQDFSALQGLTTMLGSSTGMQDAGSCFLQGLAITCKLQQQQQSRTSCQQGVLPGFTASAAGSERRIDYALVAEAVRCFFQAAAGLSDASSSALRHCIQQLHRQLTDGSSNSTVTTASSPATSNGPHASLEQGPLEVVSLGMQQLRYCECVMKLFERDGAPAGAAAFAAAALQHLPAAFADQDAGSAVLALDGTTEQERREGTLWNNLFAFNVELGRYGEAYVAVTSNPLPTRALDCLRRLVNVLCEERQVSTLLSLPFVGTVPGSASSSGGPASLSTPLVQEVVLTLRRRAHNLELGTTPQPYKVLHDFMLSRWDIKGAASALLVLARRLRLEGRSDEHTAAKALSAYDGAANLLASLDAKDAWLDLTDPWVSTYRVNDPDHQPSHSSNPVTAAAHPHLRVANEGDYPLHPQTCSTPQQDQSSNSSAALSAVSSSVTQVALTLAQIRKERWMLQAALLVSKRVPGLDTIRPVHTTATLFKQLLTLHHFDDALSLAHAAHHTVGNPLLLSAQEAVVAAIATAATLTQLSSVHSCATTPSNLFATISPHVPHPGTKSTPGFTAVLGSRFRTSPPPGPACYGSLAAPLWNKLRGMLQAAQPQLAAAAAHQQRQGYSSQASAMHTSGPGSGSQAEINGSHPHVAANSQDGGRRFSELRSAAANAVLSVDRRMELPQWLLEMFSSESSAVEGMGAACGGPAALLELYLHHQRPIIASHLVCDVLSMRGSADVRLRQTASSCWFPYRSLELLRGQLSSLAESGAANGGGGRSEGGVGGGVSGSRRRGDGNGWEVVVVGAASSSRGVAPAAAVGGQGGSDLGTGVAAAAREALLELDLAIVGHVQMASQDSTAMTRREMIQASRRDAGTRGNGSLMIMA